MNLKLLTRLAMTLGLIIIESNAYGSRDFSCSNQRSCTVNDRNMAIGDRIGFFTTHGELIASGSVITMSGSRRSVQLTQVLGPVTEKADYYAMLTGPNQMNGEEIRLYKKQSPKVAGGSISATTFGAGGDASGFEGSGVYIKRNMLLNMDGLVRSSLYFIGGTAHNSDIETSSRFRANIITAMGGLSYTWFDQKDLMIRTEGALGLGYTMASIDGDSGAAAAREWGYNVKSGIGLAARGQASMGYKMDGMTLEASVAPAMIASKTTVSLGAGLLVNLK